MEGESTSVELHILITHLSWVKVACGVICTGDWVALPSSIALQAEMLRAGFLHPGLPGPAEGSASVLLNTDCSP
jgi:hypothetical protein